MPCGSMIPAMEVFCEIRLLNRIFGFLILLSNAQWVQDHSLFLPGKYNLLLICWANILVK